MKRYLASGCVSVLTGLSLTAGQAITSVTVYASTYSPQVKFVSMQGRVISKPYGIVSGGTTYMPIWYVMQILNKLGLQNSWDGSHWNLTAPSFMPVDLTNLSYLRGTRTISLNRTTLYRVNSIAYTDPYAHSLTTYMPIWYIMQLLNRLGIGSGWDGHNWTLTAPPPMSVTVADPSQYPTLSTGNDGYPVVLLQQKLNAAGFNVGSIDGQFDSRTVLAVEALQTSAGLPADGVVGQATWLALNQKLASNYEKASGITGAGAGKVVYAWTSTPDSNQDVMQHDTVNRAGDDNYNLNANGTVSDNTASPYSMDSLQNYGQMRGLDVYATVTNIDASGSFSGTLISQILNNPSTQSAAEQNLVNVAVQKNYAGIDLDFEMVNSSDRDAFTMFVSELSTRLHAANKKLSVTLPAETDSDSEPWNHAYDYASIGNLADFVPIMAYDFSWSHSQPGAVAPLWWDDRILRYATSVMPANKILLGLAAYGYDWNSGNPNGWGKPRTLNDVDNLIQQYNLQTNWDATDSVPYITFQDSGNITHTIYYENQASIQQKLNLASQYGIGGVAFWRAGLEDEGFWNAMDAWATPNNS